MEDEKVVLADSNRTKLDLQCSGCIEGSCKFCQENKINQEDSNSSQLKCDLCQKVFDTVTLLKKHQSDHVNPMSKDWFKCPHCIKSFPSRNGLYAHQRQHPNSRQIKRRKSQSQKQPLRKVQKTQPSKQLQPAKKCLPTIQHQDTKPTQDVKQAEKLGVRRSSRTIKPPQRHVVPHYSCSKCEKMYSDQTTLENHEKSHSSISFKCNHCGKKFYEKEVLEKHIQSVHLARTRTRNRGHVCNICSKNYENRSDLFVHMRTHKSTVHLCEICGKTVSLSAYPAHKRSHLNANSQEVFQCEMCEKKFNKKISLRTHKNSNHGTLKFTCEVCGKQFTTMALMKHHQNTHSGKRDHVCQVCGRAFSLKITLKSHMRIHTGEMPYGCDNCGRYFTWKTTYRNHVANCKKVNANLDVKPKVENSYLNIQYTAQSLPQELPIDYSEDPKYNVPIDYSDESKYRNTIDTKCFPTIIHFDENIKHGSQQFVSYTTDIKCFNTNLKSPT